MKRPDPGKMVESAVMVNTLLAGAAFLALAGHEALELPEYVETCGAMGLLAISGASIPMAIAMWSRLRKKPRDIDTLLRTHIATVTAGMLTAIWLMGLHEYTENILAAIGVAVTGTAASVASLWLSARIIRGLWSKDLGRKYTEASE